MPRMTIDCRTMPSDANCTMTLTGEPDDLLEAAAAHAVTSHGHVDGPELRDGLRGAMQPASTDVAPGEFLQVIEFRTDRMAEFEAAEQEWLDAIGDARTAMWSVIAADRDDPGRYAEFVMFPNYDQAMANSKHPATQRIAERMATIATEPTFRNLDVQRVRMY